MGERGVRECMKCKKKVNEVRKEGSIRVSSVRNSMEEELSLENDVEVRWREYFVQLLNDFEIIEVGENVKRGRIGGMRE